MYQQTAWSQTDLQRKAVLVEKKVRKVNKLFSKGQRADDKTSSEEEGSRSINLSSGSSLLEIMREANPGRENAECIFCLKKFSKSNPEERWIQ